MCATIFGNWNPLAKLELMAEMPFFRQKPQFYLPVISPQVDKVHLSIRHFQDQIFYHPNIVELQG